MLLNNEFLELLKNFELPHFYNEFIIVVTKNTR